ncbi:MAG TPA: hypothetical protein VMJ65_08005 [Solirubrobacteraceae bacterium]|nr:hypothetical protein [Solirubrobacteraceae bacterium]
MENTDQSLSTRDLASPRISPEAGGDRHDEARGRRPVADRETVANAEYEEMAAEQARPSAQPVDPAPGVRDMGTAGEAPRAERSSPIAATRQASSTTTASPGLAASDLQPTPDIDADGDTTLLSAELSADFEGRWEAIQTQFVDEPRGAVQDADKLVATVMQKLAEGFAQERERLEAQWDQGEDISTEDLRVALRRYRSFFQRLLSA